MATEPHHGELNVWLNKLRPSGRVRRKRQFISLFLPLFRLTRSVKFCSQPYSGARKRRSHAAAGGACRRKGFNGTARRYRARLPGWEERPRGRTRRKHFSATPTRRFSTATRSGFRLRFNSAHRGPLRTITPSRDKRASRVTRRGFGTRNACMRKDAQERTICTGAPLLQRLARSALSRAQHARIPQCTLAAGHARRVPCTIQTGGSRRANCFGSQLHT